MYCLIRFIITFHHFYSYHLQIYLIDFTVYTVLALICDLNIVFLCTFPSAKCVSIPWMDNKVIIITVI